MREIFTKDCGSFDWPNIVAGVVVVVSFILMIVVALLI